MDIRSDLYSLGVVALEDADWQCPFRGSPAELMYQHQHASLPLEQLEDVPQPLVVLLEVSLIKTRAALSEPGRTSESVTDDNRRCRLAA